MYFASGLPVRRPALQNLEAIGRLTLRLSSSPTQLTKEARSRRVRSKR